MFKNSSSFFFCVCECWAHSQSFYTQWRLKAITIGLAFLFVLRVVVLLADSSYSRAAASGRDA